MPETEKPPAKRVDVYYKTIYGHAKKLNKDVEYKEFKENNKTSGIVRGTDYYRKDK